MRCMMIYLFVIILSLTVSSVSAQEKLVFSSFPADNPIVKICSAIIQAAYQKIGIEAVIQHYPPARGIQLANEGYTDGELYRSVRMKGKFSNLMMVPVSVAHTELVVFTKNVQFPLQGWDSLKPYRIGVERGFKLAEERSKGMKTYSASVGQTFQMLDAGRVDIVISTKLGGLSYLKSIGLKGIEILNPPLEKDMLHHFLHKKHKELVPVISAVLENMKKNGEMEAIREKAKSTLFDENF